MTTELGEENEDEEEAEEEGNNGEAGGELEPFENHIGCSRATKSENISVFMFRDPGECSKHSGSDLGCRTHLPACVVDAIDEFQVRVALAEECETLPFSFIIVRLDHYQIMLCQCTSHRAIRTKCKQPPHFGSKSILMSHMFTRVDSGCDSIPLQQQSIHGVLIPIGVLCN